MDTIGTIREISRFADYSRFGRRPSPTSIIGSRFSSVSSSSTSGCWCPYGLIVLMVIFVIASLVASNFSIYFLMKDNCDANLAKMERDFVMQTKKHPVKDNPSPLIDDSSVELKRHLSMTTLPNVKVTESNDKGPGSKLLVPQSLQAASTQPTPNKVFPRAPVERKPSPVSESKREKNVAGILQLVATIRIPLQPETSNLPSQAPSNSSRDDYFDLAKYFSLKPSSTFN